MLTGVQWRKTRQNTTIDVCPGIDINMNFDIHWPPAYPGSDNPCSTYYAGKKAFSSVEADHLAKFIKKIDSFFYIGLHSYTQVVLYPYAFSCKNPPPDAENLVELAWGLAKAIRVSGKAYYAVNQACESDDYRRAPRHGDSPEDDFIVSGGSIIDWVYVKAKVKWAYSIKQRDLGNHGFLLPRESIVPSGKEMWAMLQYAGEFLDDLENQ